jgi:hypothetical protein
MARAAGAPLVLLLVAASHVSLRYSSDLTPWKGGGFGMFSTVDSPGTRLLRVQLRSDLGTTPVAVPPWLTDLATEARAAPSEERLARLADELAGELWVIPRLPGGTSTSPEAEALDRAAIETLTEIVPVDTVRAVDPASFDAQQQEPIRVEVVEVAVLRLSTGRDRNDEGRETVRPVVVRNAAVIVPSGVGGG